MQVKERIEEKIQRKANLQALAAPLGRLSIAGEATSPQFFGTLHGAVESGQRAAAEVLGSS